MERRRIYSLSLGNLSDRRGVEAALDKRERYLAVLMEVQQALLDLRDDCPGYEKILSLLGQTVRASRVHLWVLPSGSSYLNLRSHWHDVALKRGDAQPLTYRPSSRWIGLLSQGMAIEGQVQELPAPERSLLEAQGVESLLVMPLQVQGKFWGVLGFDQCRKSLAWATAERSLLTAATTAIALHQERHQAELALRQFQSPAAEVAQNSQTLTQSSSSPEFVRPEADSLTKSGFLSTMSHELRTPLNAILGFTQLLSQETRLSAEQHSYVKTIDRNGQHLLRLINNALEMARLEAGSVGVADISCDLHRLLKQVEATFRPQASAKHLSFSLECDRDVPQFIVTDEAKLHQVLTHLLDNAIKFTQTGGVRVRVGRVAGVIAPSHCLRFEVEDSGCGLSAENLIHLRQPFAPDMTGLRSPKGMGLGLVITRRIAHLMGGELTVHSNPGQGSTFAFEVSVEVGCDDLHAPEGEAIALDKSAKHRTVNCTYENWIPQEPIADPRHPDLSVMPEQWIAQLCEAASGCYDQQIFELIEQIPLVHRSLAAVLFHLAYNFQFEEILNLAQRSPHARFH
ncbi:MAG TPA: ATP-binding protein [Thermosynechococcaceae cyanobacterium]